MGRGIARMLLQEQGRQGLSIDLSVFDPNQLAEEKCLKEIKKSKLGTIILLRDFISKENTARLQKHLAGDSLESQSYRRISSILFEAISNIQPSLIVNAATYFAQHIYIPLARRIKSDYIDLGQQLPSFQELREIDNSILQKGEQVRIIQESGLAPGLANILAVSMYEKALAESSANKVHTVQMRVGGLPQHTSKGDALHYGPTFSPDGLLYEYTENAYCLHDGQLVTTNTFSNPEFWENTSVQPLPYGIRPFLIESPEIQQILSQRAVPPHFKKEGKRLVIQNLEARPTADGTSRMCFDPIFQKTVHNLEYKTLRYAPHYQTWSKLATDGTLKEILEMWKQHIDEPQVSGYPDLILLRVWAKSAPESAPYGIEFIVLHDENSYGDEQSFTAMQHLTGWPTILLAMALLKNPSGSKTYQSTLFRSPDALTSFGRSLKNVIEFGGIITPYELLNGIQLLDMLTKKERIPLNQSRISFQMK
jgi:saccharopine dehydrogenase-like NADP-dependent oxidoreductase